MSFCTAINCMDGRTQLPVNEYLRQLLGVTYVDTVTEPGPVRILADEPQSDSAGAILKRVDISVHKHRSQCIALVAHHDCAGNPADEKAQRDQSQRAIQFLRDRYSSVQLLALWVDSTWSVSRIS
jgi:hypothetical protein